MPTNILKVANEDQIGFTVKSLYPHGAKVVVVHLTASFCILFAN